MNRNYNEIYYEMEEKENELMLKGINDIYINTIITPYKNSEKIIDMHTHTNYSGGDLTPQELIRLAINKKIGTLAITDYNTLQGIKQINKNDSLIVDSKIKIIKGIELSVTFKKTLMHIIGYNVDENNKSLNYKLNNINYNNINYILFIIKQLKKDYGIIFKRNDIKNLINTKQNLNKLDLAKLCVKYGYTTTVQEAFNKYLNHFYKQTSKKLELEECLELIKNSGGIPTLAYPKFLKLNKKEFLKFLKIMINYGLQGIEVYHPNHTKEETKYYLYLANMYDLLISGGSDYYGKTINPTIELGTGKNNNIKIKRLSLLEKIP